MYRTILIPLENSPTDEAILAHVRPLARLAGSALVLIHVADGFGARYQKALNLEDSQEMREDRAYLERRAAELRAEGFACRWTLASGVPAAEILRVADAEEADLIAMSTHGHRFVMDLLLGSVAEDVRHKARAPVLLVRAQADDKR